MKNLVAIVALALGMIGCSVDSAGTSSRSHEVLGSVGMPLTKTVDGIEYKVTGTVSITNATTNVVAASVNLDTIVSDQYAVQVPVGDYNVSITGWHIFYVNGPKQTDVTSVSQLVSPASQSITVYANSQTNVGFDFLVDGILVALNPCNTPLNLSCGSQDMDNDGFTNIVECPTYPILIDTDGDKAPDCNDTDSDGDGTPDAAEADNDARTNPCLPDNTVVGCPSVVGSIVDGGAQDDGGSVNIGIFVCHTGSDSGCYMNGADAGTSL